jgi:hypothetical protein
MTQTFSTPTVMTAKFAGICTRCGQHFAAGSLIAWTRGAGATHAAICPTPVPAAAPTCDPSAIVTFLQRASAHLKFPKACFLAPGGGELRLSVAGPQSRTPGAVQVVVRDAWQGRILPNGTVQGLLATNRDLLATLDTIAADPATAAAEYGRLMGRCSFCHLQLTDAGSTEVGYGPVCAKHYGLPHHPKGTPELLAVAS